MRVSVTVLENFRRYMAGLCWCHEECHCEADLIASIRGVFVPNARMEAGSRFHKAIETADFSGFDGQSVVDALLLADMGRVAKPLSEHRGIHEGKFTASIAGVLVVGKFDYLNAGVVYDWKTTDKSSGGDYTDSLQWRLTLAALPEITRFRYETFQLKADDPRASDQGDGSADAPLTLVKYLPPGQEFTRYPGLLRECEAWMMQFLGFVSLRSLGAHVADKPGNEFPEAAA